MDKIFLIEARTGCTCCSDENHIRGPYRTIEDAQRRVAYYKSKDSKYWPVASQYSRRGNYYIKEISVEHLPDGRIILGGNKVFAFLAPFIDVHPDGIVDDNDGERWDIGS